MVRTATPFPMISLLFVFTAFVISNIGHIRPQRTILAFVSGIFFILSGKLYGNIECENLPNKFFILIIMFLIFAAHSCVSAYKL